MTPPPAPLLEMWDCPAVPRPPHSRLYPLVPWGLGTPLVESFTSYLTRLAAAHRVTPSHLLLGEILPALGCAYLLRAGSRGLGSLWASAGSLNALGARSANWVQTLSTLTGRTDLRFTTLGPWAEVLSPCGLFRPTRAWCPACYRDWAATGQPCYDPLLWAVALIQHCPQHRQALHQQCPGCARRLYHLAPAARAGYCPRCGHWLGAAAGAPPPPDPPAAHPEQAWISAQVGALLAGAPHLAAPPAAAQVSRTLAAWMARLDQGQVMPFARRLQVPSATVRCWLIRQCCPELGTLLQVCAYLDTDLASLVSGQPGLRPTPRPPPPADLRLVGRHRRPRGPVDRVHLQQTLETLRAQADPPLSLYAVARQVGYAASQLLAWFPELSQAVVEQYRAYIAQRKQTRRVTLAAEIRRIMTELQQQGHYPGAKLVRQQLPQPQILREAWAVQIYQETLDALGYGVVRPRGGAVP